MSTALAAMDYMSPTTLSQQLGISRATVYNLMDRGQLPFYQIAGVRRIARVDVERFLAERRKES